MEQLKQNEPFDFEFETKRRFYREIEMARGGLPSNSERAILVRKIRKELRLSQKDFANYMHISRRTLQNWEYQISPVPGHFFNQLIWVVKKINPNFNY